MCMFCLIFRVLLKNLPLCKNCVGDCSFVFYFSLFSAAPHVPMLVFLIHFCSRTPQRDGVCWMEDRFSAYCATSVVQTNKNGRTWGRQMESHCCPGRRRAKLSLRFGGKSGSSANCVSNRLLPANKRKTSWPAEVIAFFTKVEDLKLLLVLRQRRRMDWLFFSQCCLSAAAVNLSLARNQKQKFISWSSRLSEAERTCLFHRIRRCSSQVHQRLFLGSRHDNCCFFHPNKRIRQLYMLRSVITSASISEGQSREVSAAHTGLNVAFKATLVSKNERQKKSLTFLDVLLKSCWVLHPIQRISTNWRELRSGPVKPI